MRKLNLHSKKGLILWGNVKVSSKSDHSFMFFNPAVIRNGALFVADCSGCFYQRTEKQICNLILLSLSLSSFSIHRVLNNEAPEYILSKLYMYAPTRYSNCRNYQLSLPRPRIDIFKKQVYPSLVLVLAEPAWQNRVSNHACESNVPVWTKFPQATRKYSKEC